MIPQIIELEIRSYLLPVAFQYLINQRMLIQIRLVFDLINDIRFNCLTNCGVWYVSKGYCSWFLGL